jgi:hypothetical protein
MAEGRVFDVFVNPIAFFEVDEPWAKQMAANLSLESVLGYACAPGLKSDLQSLVGRYREISKERKRLFAPPAEEHILSWLIWPLRHAKASYMFGNYLGTVALCGMVAEMATILRWEIADITINGKSLDEDAEKELFGRTFEKLGQERRVDVLRAWGLINDELQTALNTVREKRRKYLHLYTCGHDQLAADAVAVFEAAVTVVVGVIGQDVRDGKIVLTPAMLRYLERIGVMRPDEEKDSDGLGSQNAGASEVPSPGPRA